MRFVSRRLVLAAVAACLPATAAFAQQPKDVKLGYALAVNSHYGAAAQAWAEWAVNAS